MGPGGGGGDGAAGVESSPGETPGAAGVKRDAESLSRNGDGDADADADGGEAAGDEGGSRARKKKTGPGGRGVANLTPEQLAKKRANDREAQRAIRERTKNQIETLERRIEELTSLEPYQELQAVVRAKEAVEQENAEIKRQLAAVVRVLKPIIGEGASESSYVAPTPAFVAPAAAQTPGMQHNASASASPAAGHAEHAHVSQQSWHQGEQQQQQQQHADPAAAQLHLQRHQLQHGLDMGPERLGLDFLLRPGQQVSRVQSALHGAQDSPQFHHVPMKHDWTAATNSPALRTRHSSLGSSASAGAGGGDASSLSMSGQSPSTAGPSPYGPAPAPAPGADPDNLPRYAVPIKNCGPTCPLDSLLLDFLSERRQRAADGLPMHEVVGPRYPSVSSLLNPANSVYSHPLSKVFTDILATFPDISALPERVAVLYVMFLVMRWQIAPTRENYARLPPWMRPSPAQLLSPHPAWVDHLPFPAMRDALVRLYNPEEYLFDNFFIPFTTTLRLSWPYEETDTLLVVPPDAAAADDDEVVINPVFERHLRNLDNWRLGDRFVRAFPALADTCNLDAGAGGAASSVSSMSR